MRNTITVLTLSTILTFAILFISIGADAVHAERLAVTSMSSSSRSIAKSSSSTATSSASINYCPIGVNPSSTSTVHAPSSTSASAKKRGHSDSSSSASDRKAATSSKAHRHTSTVSCVPRPSNMQTVNSSPITAVINATGVSASQAMVTAQSGAMTTIPGSLTVLFALIATFFWTFM